MSNALFAAKPRAQQQLWFHELTHGENLENLGAVRTLPNQKCFRMKGKPKLFGGTGRVVPVGGARPS
jgi:hypothetical protein